jgi:hypothetical protein
MANSKRLVVVGASLDSYRQLIRRMSALGYRVELADSIAKTWRALQELVPGALYIGVAAGFVRLVTDRVILSGELVNRLSCRGGLFLCRSKEREMTHLVGFSFEDATDKHCSNECHFADSISQSESVRFSEERK